MGTIIALGGGRYDDGEVMPIFERIVRESGKKNPHVVFLPTAGHDDTEGDEPIWESFEKLGCTVETLKLTDPANSREHIYDTLVNTDIVYAGGGNLEFMMNTFKATGADEALREAYKRGKVLSGLSSGAMCWFDMGYDDCGENGSFMFVDCIGTSPLLLLPALHQRTLAELRDSRNRLPSLGHREPRTARRSYSKTVISPPCAETTAEACSILTRTTALQRAT